MKKKEAIYIFFVLILSFAWFRQCRETKKLESMAEVEADSLRITLDEAGRMSARIKSFEVQSKNDFLSHKSKDSTIQWLQKTVKEYKGKLSAAIVAGTTTNSSGTTVTNFEPGDTVEVGDTIFIYGKYSTTWQTEWEQGYILATRDSIHREIATRNEFEFSIGRENNQWFKKRTTEVLMRNLNPNTITTELRSYNVSQRPKRVNFIIYTGYGFCSAGLSPQIGVGIGYTVFGMK